MKRVLLLTPYYFPVKILRWQDAVKMKYEHTVDVVVEYDETVSSPSITWKIPAVVRLRKMAKLDQKGVKFSRRNVYQRDGYTCQYCGKKKPARELSYDHVVPRASGGRTVWTNIVTACRACNTKKDDQTCDEAGMWPKSAPRRPAELPLAPPIFDRNIPPEWEGFCAGLERWTPKDPYKAGRGYDHRDDFPGAKATRRRRGSNQWARKQGQRVIAEQLAEQLGEQRLRALRRTTA